MDWKVITINVFYVQLLKVGFCSNDDIHVSVPNILLCFPASIQCSNDDISVPNILLCFSASIQMVLFSESVSFQKSTRFS